MANKDLRDYEIVLVLSPEATEDEAGATVETVATFIGDRGGVINHQENWGVRRLAYPIRRFSEGNYFLARFTLDGENVIELDRTINASQSVLRHIVVRLEKAALAALEKQTADNARRAAEAQARAERDAKEIGVSAEEPDGTQGQDDLAEQDNPESKTEADNEQAESEIKPVTKATESKAEEEVDAESEVAEATESKAEEEVDAESEVAEATESKAKSKPKAKAKDKAKTTTKAKSQAKPKTRSKSKAPVNTDPESTGEAAAAENEDPDE